MVARLPGGAHCQPMTSWDHTIVPNVRNTATAPPSVARLALTWSVGAQQLAAQARAAQPGQHA